MTRPSPYNLAAGRSPKAAIETGRERAEMNLKTVTRAALSLALLILVCEAAVAYSIVNVPTANQAALREVNLAYYSMSVDRLPVTHKDIIIIYSTVAPNFEVEYFHININKGAPSQNLVNASYRLVSETAQMPDVVVGAKNIFEDDHSPNPDEQKRSYYIATAKTLNPPKPGAAWQPVVRLHVNYGTREHRGLFGGVQIAVTPQLGIAAMKFSSSPYVDTFFGNSMEYAIVYSLGKGRPTLKAGTLGRHEWVGLDYSIFF
jgi:hypothetical protein